MKTTILLATVASLGLTAAHAEPKGPGRPVPPEVLERFDLDKDGKLSPEERKAAMAERRQKMLEKFDTDGDGQLSETEREAARAAFEARRQELLAKYDADQDGKLSREEIAAARAAGEEIPPPPHGKGPGPRKGQKAD